MKIAVFKMKFCFAESKKKPSSTCDTETPSLFTEHSRYIMTVSMESVNIKREEEKELCRMDGWIKDEDG